MCSDLNGFNIVVTGASSGIGRAVAQTAVARGAVVGMIADRGGRFDDITFHDFVIEKPQVAMWRCDVSDYGSLKRFAARFQADVGPIDAWVNCAGVLLVQGFQDFVEIDWRRLFAVDVGGYINGARCAVDAMADHGGSIVNVTSVVDIQPISGLSAYSCAKGAIVALTRTLALELGPLGIRVNAVAPGAVDTPLNDNAYTPPVQRRYRDRIPLGRIAEPTDVAEPILFLCGPQARYITGHELLVDGGLILNGNMGHLSGT